MKIGIVGAGISGLAISVAAEKAGHEVVLFESESDVGGRMSSIRFGPYIIDIGFHVLHTAYPSLHRWIDFRQLEFKEMEKCTESIDPDTGKRKLLADAINMPLKLFPTLRAIGLRDGLRLLRWRLASNSKDMEAPLDFKSEKIMEGFRQRGFSNNLIQNILRPLFAGITLDPDLEERMSFASFTWAAMSLGSMIMPKGGIQAVPNQLVNRLINTKLRFNSKVDAVSSTTITNKDTEQINKNIQIEAEFILEQQQIRMDIQPNYAFIQDLGIMDHVRAGLKTKSMNEWDSKDPVFKAFIDPICIIEYRDEKRTQYEAGDTINGTSMVIQSCNKDSVVVHIDSNKDDIQQRVFYMSKEKKE